MKLHKLNAQENMKKCLLQQKIENNSKSDKLWNCIEYYITVKMNRL